MQRTLIAGLVLLAATGPASAEAFACRSMEGDPPASLDFKLDRSNNAYAVTSATFQIEDDLGYATTATEPDSRATITAVAVPSSADVAFRFHFADGDYDGDVASVHVVTLSEGAFSLTAGVLQVVGGGLWAISCDLDHEG